MVSGLAIPGLLSLAMRLRNKTPAGVDERNGDFATVGVVRKRLLEDVPQSVSGD
jgi:hypothetical protein